MLSFALCSWYLYLIIECMPAGEGTWRAKSGAGGATGITIQPIWRISSCTPINFGDKLAAGTDERAPLTLGGNSVHDIRKSSISRVKFAVVVVSRYALEIVLFTEISIRISSCYVYPSPTNAFWHQPGALVFNASVCSHPWR